MGKVKSGHECANTGMCAVQIQPSDFSCVSEAAMCNVAVSPDPRNFFPDVKDNLTKIIWAHAVNSQAELEKALSSGRSIVFRDRCCSKHSRGIPPPFLHLLYSRNGETMASPMTPVALASSDVTGNIASLSFSLSLSLSLSDALRIQVSKGGTRNRSVVVESNFPNQDMPEFET